MRFYNGKHRYFCGIDLHARSMYVCVLDPEGQVLLHRDLPTDPDVFLKAIAPFRENLAVAVECISPGTGSPTCVPEKVSTSFSVMRCT